MCANAWVLLSLMFSMWAVDMLHVQLALKEGTTKAQVYSSLWCYLVKVCWEPVHDHIERIVKGEVVDDNGPNSRMSHHAPPGSWRRPAPLASFPG